MKPNKNFIEVEKRFTGAFKESLRQTLIWAYKPFFKRIVFALTIGFIGRICLLFTANVIGYWVDTFCYHSADYLEGKMQCHPIPFGLTNLESNQFVLLILILCSFGFTFTAIYRVVFSRLSAKAVSQIYDEVTFRTSRYPMSFFDMTPAGRIITRFSSDYGNVFRLFGGPLAEFLAIIFDLISMVILITLASPIFLGLVALMAGLNYLVFRLNRDQLRAERRELSFSRSPSIAHFSETSQGASTIRTYLRENSFFNRFKKLNDFYQNQKLRTIKKVTFYSFQMNSLSALLLLVTGLTSYALVENKILTVGAVGVAFTFISFSGNTIQMFFEWLSQFEEAIIGVERLDQYLRNPIESGAYLPEIATFATNHWRAKDTVSPSPLKMKDSSEIEFKDLSFKYRDDLPEVLKNISFQVKAGERLGVVGKTGSGKSTLIQCLFHLYPLTEGTISIDHKRPYWGGEKQSDNISLDEFRSQISFISQDPTLFKGSLRSNLSFNDNILDSKLIHSLDQVGLSDWYSQLNEGLDFLIEEKGRNLSQGERQLLCMARCLLQDTPVVIMDEATSNVDPQSEAILVKATDEFFDKKTQIIIAHRLSTLEKCDRVLWIHEGKIRGLGPTKEILSLFQKNEIGEVLKS